MVTARQCPEAAASGWSGWDFGRALVGGPGMVVNTVFFVESALVLGVGRFLLGEFDVPFSSFFFCSSNHAAVR